MPRLDPEERKLLQQKRLQEALAKKVLKEKSKNALTPAQLAEMKRKKEEKKANTLQKQKIKKLQLEQKQEQLKQNAEARGGLTVQGYETMQQLRGNLNPRPNEFDDTQSDVIYGSKMRQCFIFSKHVIENTDSLTLFNRNLAYTKQVAGGDFTTKDGIAEAQTNLPELKHFKQLYVDTNIWTKYTAVEYEVRTWGVHSRIYVTFEKHPSFDDDSYPYDIVAQIHHYAKGITLFTIFDENNYSRDGSIRCKGNMSQILTMKDVYTAALAIWWTIDKGKFSKSVYAGQKYPSSCHGLVDHLVIYLDPRNIRNCGKYGDFAFSSSKHKKSRRSKSRLKSVRKSRRSKSRRKSVRKSRRSKSRRKSIRKSRRRRSRRKSVRKSRRRKSKRKSVRKSRRRKSRRKSIRKSRRRRSRRKSL
jgi:hypothetical protein